MGVVRFLLANGGDPEVRNAANQDVEQVRGKGREEGRRERRRRRGEEEEEVSQEERVGKSSSRAQQRSPLQDFI